ncbi:uncharacterized protein LOC126739449 [Anthonomus grandis grandis]|uniref:uncharacterized protein LOC126739449 n=1 Tax=Anthonomus grandis grandis TaxID=2921223 RepID=UPI002166AD03|nr:uncharacterized protein LOC126739449 [Anthonomus grandis grandis]
MSHQENNINIYSLIFFSIFMVAKGNLCTPGLVTDIYFNESSILTWSQALNPENCSITSYVINVFDIQNGLQLQFQIPATDLSYNFKDILNMCQIYTFEVHALTNAFVLGPSDKINGTTSAASNMNLSLLLWTNPTDDLSVTWNLKDSTVGNCVSFYRVVYWDLDNKPSDIYVPENTFNLLNITSCMIYHVQVNAIVVNPDLEGPISEVALQSPSSIPKSPRFVNMSSTSNDNTMFWGLPKFMNDRCALTGLTVVTIGAPENSSVITVPITDNFVRSDVKVVIPYLDPDSVYISYVSLQNNYGSSKNITVSFQTNSL